MSERSILILTPGRGANPDPPIRRRGRPPAAQPKTSISAWIPVSHYDRLAALAARRDESLSRLVGEAVRTLIRQKP
jgi:hypothetical protein